MTNPSTHLTAQARCHIIHTLYLQKAVWWFK